MDAPDFDDTVIRPPAPGRAGAPGVDGSGIVLRRSDVEGDTIVREASVAGPSSDGAESGDVAVAAVPSGHRVSINGAAPIRLDVPHLVGRSPRIPRVVSGVPPKLVTVPSPRSEVSATHVELSQIGTSIVITDLRSTNGIVVTMPGSVPLTMRSGESLVAVPGTIVDIGDGNRIEIVPPPRLIASDTDESAR